MKNIKELLNTYKNIIGKKVADIKDSEVWCNHVKSAAGYAAELFVNQTPHPDNKADVQLEDGTAVEIKCVHSDGSLKKDFRAGEHIGTTKTMDNPCFYDSHLYEKMRKTLVISYDRVNGKKDTKNYTFSQMAFLDIDQLPDDIQLRMAEEYEFIYDHKQYKEIAIKKAGLVIFRQHNGKIELCRIFLDCLFANDWSKLEAKIAVNPIEIKMPLDANAKSKQAVAA